MERLNISRRSSLITGQVRWTRKCYSQNRTIVFCFGNSTSVFKLFCSVMDENLSGYLIILYHLFRKTWVVSELEISSFRAELTFLDSNPLIYCTGPFSINNCIYLSPILGPSRGHYLSGHDTNDHVVTMVQSDPGLWLKWLYLWLPIICLSCYQFYLSKTFVNTLLYLHATVFVRLFGLGQSTHDERYFVNMWVP
jgi:hypothetical protein